MRGSDDRDSAEDKESLLAVHLVRSDSNWEPTRSFLEMCVCVCVAPHITKPTSPPRPWRGGGFEDMWSYTHKKRWGPMFFFFLRNPISEHHSQVCVSASAESKQSFPSTLVFTSSFSLSRPLQGRTFCLERRPQCLKLPPSLSLSSGPITQKTVLSKNRNEWGPPWLHSPCPRFLFLSRLIQLPLVIRGIFWLVRMQMFCRSQDVSRPLHKDTMSWTKSHITNDTTFKTSCTEVWLNVHRGGGGDLNNGGIYRKQEGSE